MNTRILLPIAFGVLCGTVFTAAQGSFQNLGFESATIVQAPAGGVACAPRTRKSETVRNIAAVALMRDS